MLVYVFQVAHTTDNTASNTVMNDNISKWLAKVERVHVHRTNMQVRCSAHVLNLAVQ